MRYYVFQTKGGDWGIWLNYGNSKSDCGGTAYAIYETEREAIEKCEKLNAMLYPQPYIFIER